ncbi:MAG TPA: hypothetical protein VEJ42_01115 [Streptosporangiaceae bacterium]|nr:hypothetical protein [Streptosporangiaceae bacterium]
MRTTRSPETQARRVARLLRCYPRSWRHRYGAEFAELLLADLADRPRDLRRTVDVVRSGMAARLTAAGLTDHELPPAEQIRACLGTVGGALAVIASLGVAMLAQLATSWQRASGGPATAAVGTLGMTAAAVILGALCLAAAGPFGWQLVGAARRHGSRIGPSVALVVAGVAVLVLGSLHFANHWPGTGGTGAEHGLVPGGLAAFGWASTLSLSSFWAHPALLARFPAAELGWMAASPVAWTSVAAGLVTMTRRLELPPAVLRYLAGLAAAGTAAAVVFLVGGASWVLARSAGQLGPFRPGLVDGGELLIMALALIVAVRATGGIRRARQAMVAVRRRDADLQPK